MSWDVFFLLKVGSSWNPHWLSSSKIEFCTRRNVVSNIEEILIFDISDEKIHEFQHVGAKIKAHPPHQTAFLVQETYISFDYKQYNIPFNLYTDMWAKSYSPSKESPESADGFPTKTYFWGDGSSINHLKSYSLTTYM